MAITIILGLCFSSAHGQLGFQNFRHIHINGVHLSDQEILGLDQTLGYTVPNGFYWLNTETGEWGYEGNGEVLGSIYPPGSAQGQANSQSEQSNQQNSGSSQPYINNDTGTGGGVINPDGCSYVTAGGMTFKSC